MMAEFSDGQSTAEPAVVMKGRLRIDLTTAMKARKGTDVTVLRVLIAALDNAEAPVVEPRDSHDVKAFEATRAEAAPLSLSWTQVHHILGHELGLREAAAADFERLQMPEKALTLREEAEVIRRYLVWKGVTEVAI